MRVLHLGCWIHGMHSKLTRWHTCILQDMCFIFLDSHMASVLPACRCFTSSYKCFKTIWESSVFLVQQMKNAETRTHSLFSATLCGTYSRWTYKTYPLTQWAILSCKSVLTCEGKGKGKDKDRGRGVSLSSHFTTISRCRTILVCASCKICLQNRDILPFLFKLFFNKPSHHTCWARNCMIPPIQKSLGHKWSCHYCIISNRGGTHALQHLVLSNAVSIVVCFVLYMGTPNNCLNPQFYKCKTAKLFLPS